MALHFMNKESLRSEAKKIRAAMPASDVEAKSQLIAKRLIREVDWLKVKSVHTYSAIKKLNEVDTSTLTSYITENHPDIDVMVQGQSLGKPPTGKFNLIIVPTLAFDKNRNRLGWGGGWYDKFLAGQTQAKKIGLCFENGKVDEIPAEPHDISLDTVITELYNY